MVIEGINFDKLKRLRELFGYSIPELAKKSDVSDVTIRNYEKGKTRGVQTPKLKKIAQVYGITLNDIVSEESAQSIYDRAMSEEQSSANDASQLDKLLRMTMIVQGVKNLFSMPSFTQQDEMDFLNAAKRALSITKGEA